MKAGFWIAPEGAASPVTLLPIGAEEAPRRAAASALATAGAEELVARCPRVAALLPLMIAALEARAAGQPGQLFDLAGLDEPELKLIADVTGAGEVAATVALPDGVVAQIQESVMAGLWRVRFADANGHLIADYLEVGAIPEAVRRAAAMTRSTVTRPAGGASVTALALLSEIEQHVGAWRPGADNHIVTLSLLPVSADDMAVLQATLGDGPVQIVSRGYGSCRVLATATRNLWSVQYFNSTGDIVLDTLEVGEVPAVACAAAEDFQDSAERLRQIEEAYFA
jgi:hydrogenase-1 operon protein HyaF